jgi:hypothetical protein
MQFIIDNKVIFLGVALAISEALSLIPSVKANGIFQLIVGWLRNIKK